MHASGAPLHGTEADLAVGDLLMPGMPSNYSWREVEDTPKVTDKKFPGNPTRSYRTREPGRIVQELTDWAEHSPEQLDTMRGKTG